MIEKTINFGNKKINKSKFNKTKRLFKTDDINIDKILISKKKNPVEKKVHLMELHSNILLLMRIMIILVLYAKSFLK